MKYTLRTELPSIIIIIASFLLAGYFYAHFPERVITHWNFEGVADGYSSRAFGAWLFPFIIAAMYGMFNLLPKIDPKRERYASFERTYHILKSVMIFIFFVLFLVTGLVNLGYPIPVNLVVPFFIGILFIVLGNYMGKVKQNWFLGFRFPWTLSSENVWNKTHRFGGWAMILSGVLLMITPLFPRLFGMVIFAVAILTMTLGTMVYSYLSYRAELHNKVR